LNNNQNIENLFQRFLDNKCTQAEVKILLQYFDADENEVLLRSLIRKQSEAISDTPLSSEKLETLLESTYRKIADEIAGDTAIASSPVIPLYHRLWFRISAAAAVIFFISVTAFYFLHQYNDRTTVQTQNSTQLIKDIPPGTNNAVLTLDNGTMIVLDSAANGTLTQQGGIKVLKVNGQIAYDKTGNANLQAVPIYNTITTARGNQYQVVLADGSKVWLNAASSIRFPSFFTGNERKVEITGEAYFEVAKDATKPFRVEFNNQRGEKAEIEVLGTHFNVNAYPDEEDVKTTLLEGSVKVSKGNESLLIVPGEQARVSNNSSGVKEITLKKDVVLSQVMAWRDGFFVFNNSDIKMIMRQVARWYDVEVDFEGKIPSEGFTGKVSRNVPLSKFIKVLKLNDVNVKTEGRKIIIAP
jgi:hypothetical protein